MSPTLSVARDHSTAATKESRKLTAGVVARAELRLLADSNSRRVEKYGAEVDENSHTNRDLGTVITIERRLDRRVRARIPEQFAQQRGPAGAVRRITRVVTLKQAPRVHPSRDQLRVGCRIQLPRNILPRLLGRD
jgi:hypothetical protein